MIIKGIDKNASANTHKGKGMRQKMAAIMAALALAGTLCDCSFGENLKGIGSSLGHVVNVVIGIEEQYAMDRLFVYTDSNGDYKICVRNYFRDDGIDECLTGKPLLDENGNECSYYEGIYLPAESSDEVGDEKDRYIKKLNRYLDVGQTYLPDVAGIPLGNILPDEVKEQFGRSAGSGQQTVSKENLTSIYADIDSYMLDYLKNREFPTCTNSDHWEQKSEKWREKHEDDKEESLQVYVKCDENGHAMPEVVVGYAVWRPGGGIDTSYFYDVTNNQFKSTHDEDGNMQYRCKGHIEKYTYLPESVAGIEDIEEARKRVYDNLNRSWLKDGYSYEEIEYKPLFLDDEQTVSFAGIEEVAYDGASMDAMDSVRTNIQRAEATIGENQAEQGE